MAERTNSGDVLEALAEFQRRGEAVVLITVIAKEGHGPATPGAKMLVAEGGRAAGTVGGGAVEHIAIHKAQELLRLPDPAPLYEVYDFGADEEIVTQSGLMDAAPGGAGSQATGMVCGGRASLFYECYGTGESLFVFGAGHIGRALARFLPGLGYRLTVVDSREEYARSFAEAVGPSASLARAVHHAYDTSFADLNIPKNSWIIIATHSHAFDYQVLEQCLKADIQFRHIGMVASRKKRDKFFAQLRETVPNADTSLVYMPAGLDIGGTGPEEIALSLVSELQVLRYGRAGHKHMRDRSGAIDEG